MPRALGTQPHGDIAYYPDGLDYVAPKGEAQLAGLCLLDGVSTAVTGEPAGKAMGMAPPDAGSTPEECAASSPVLANEGLPDMGNLDVECANAGDC